MCIRDRIQTQKYQGLGAPEISHQLEREIKRSHHRPPSTRNFAGSQASHRTGCSRISKASQQSGIPDVNQLVRDVLQSNADLEKERIATEKQRQQTERDEQEKRIEIEREVEEKRW